MPLPMLMASQEMVEEVIGAILATPATWAGVQQATRVVQAPVAPNLTLHSSSILTEMTPGGVYQVRTHVLRTTLGLVAMQAGIMELGETIAITATAKAVSPIIVVPTSALGAHLTGLWV